MLAWRQVAGLIAAIPHDRPLADDMAYVASGCRHRAAAPRVHAASAGAATASAQSQGQAVKAKAKAKAKARAAPKRRSAKAAPRKTCPPRAMTGHTPPFLTIAEASRLIAAKRLSPVELVKELLARIEAIDPQLERVPAGDRAAARWPRRAPPSGR